MDGGNGRGGGSACGVCSTADANGKWIEVFWFFFPKKNSSLFFEKKEQKTLTPWSEDVGVILPLLVVAVHQGSAAALVVDVDDGWVDGAGLAVEAAALEGDQGLGGVVGEFSGVAVLVAVGAAGLDGEAWDGRQGAVGEEDAVVGAGFDFGWAGGLGGGRADGGDHDQRGGQVA